MYRLLIIPLLFFYACKCQQNAKGVVLDKATRMPLKYVYIEAKDNPYSGGSFTDPEGRFNYGTLAKSSGFSCPDMVLYFKKPGYRDARVVYLSSTQTDTVLLELLAANLDLSPVISRKEFDAMVNHCYTILQTKKLQQMDDADHIQTIMALNTIFIMRLDGGRYQQLEALTEQLNYGVELTKIYTDYTYNRGMGFYFPKLHMELYGTPRQYSVFDIKD